MARPTWDDTWLALACVMALRSKCPVQVGAVIVDSQQRVVSTGYAGPPANWRHSQTSITDHCQSYCARASLHPSQRDHSYGDCPTSHAEANALMFADRSRIEGGTIYVSSVSCFNCIKMIGNSGVVRVVWLSIPEVDETREHRKVSVFLLECGIEAIAVDPKTLAVKIGATA